MLPTAWKMSIMSPVSNLIHESACLGHQKENSNPKNQTGFLPFTFTVIA